MSQNEQLPATNDSPELRKKIFDRCLDVLLWVNIHRAIEEWGEIKDLTLLSNVKDKLGDTPEDVQEAMVKKFVRVSLEQAFGDEHGFPWASVDQALAEAEQWFSENNPATHPGLTAQEIWNRAKALGLKTYACMPEDELTEAADHVSRPWPKPTETELRDRIFNTCLDYFLVDIRRNISIVIAEWGKFPHFAGLWLSYPLMHSTPGPVPKDVKEAAKAHIRVWLQHVFGDQHDFPWGAVDEATAGAMADAEQWFDENDPATHSDLTAQEIWSRAKALGFVTYPHFTSDEELYGAASHVSRPSPQMASAETANRRPLPEWNIYSDSVTNLDKLKDCLVSLPISTIEGQPYKVKGWTLAEVAEKIWHFNNANIEIPHPTAVRWELGLTVEYVGQRDEYICFRISRDAWVLGHEDVTFTDW